MASTEYETVVKDKISGGNKTLMEMKDFQLSLDSDTLDSWRAIGSSENVLRDNDIAKLLLSVYHSMKQNRAMQSHVQCSQCHSPLILYCASCQQPVVHDPESGQADVAPCDINGVCNDGNAAKHTTLLSDAGAGSSAVSSRGEIQQLSAMLTLTHGTKASDPDTAVKIKVEAEEDAVEADYFSREAAWDGSVGRQTYSIPTRNRKKPGRFSDWNEWITPVKRKRNKSCISTGVRRKQSRKEGNVPPQQTNELCSDKTLKVSLSRCDVPSEQTTFKMLETGIILNKNRRQHAIVHVFSDNYFDERTAETFAPYIPKKRNRQRRKGQQSLLLRLSDKEGEIDLVNSLQESKGDVDIQGLGDELRAESCSAPGIRGRPIHILVSDRVVGSLRLPSGKKPVYSWFECALCNLAFRLKTSFNQHVTSHTTGNLGENDNQACEETSHRKTMTDGPLICSECGKSYSSKSSLYFHVVNVHTNSKNRVRCDLCGQPFTSEANVQTHKRKRHPLGSSLKCKWCDYTCVAFKDMRNHKKKHEKRAQVQCEYCGVYLGSSITLKEHILLHKGEKPHSCPHCGKAFRTLSQMNTHIKGYHGEIERPYRCDQCGRGFIKKDNLKHHMYSHTGEKPHKCSICPSVFARKDYLQKHMRTHTGEKPYTCNLCDVKFAFPGSLKLHKLKSHGIQPVKREVEDRNKVISIDAKQIDVNKFDFLQPGVLLPFYPIGESDIFFRETIVPEASQND